MFKKLTFYIVIISIAILVLFGWFLYSKNNGYKLLESESISKELFWFIKTIVGTVIATLQLLASGIIKIFTETKQTILNSKGEEKETIIERKSITLLEKEPRFVALGAAAIFIAIMVL